MEKVRQNELMIKVSGVTKKYPAQLAVDHISFEVGRGEIVGFLGLNGAGKTTTMRMLTGYLPMSSGCIEINGLDISKQHQEVCRNVGYLPENCPLYPEMRVNEYLKFRASLKGLKTAARRNRVNEAKEQCGLSEVGRRIIGQLSRGYRQRVGLADSLINEPDLLILDEPTVGLDPYQIRQVRKLITRLAKRHTILLSTHILQEVEAVCERILVIDHGKIVASDTKETLLQKLHRCSIIEMEVMAGRDAVMKQIDQIDGLDMRNASELPGGWLRLEIEADSTARRVDLFNLSVKKRWKLRQLFEQPRSLEETFVQITGRKKKQ